MATKRKTISKTTIKKGNGRVVGSTTETQKEETLIGADVVTLRVSLRRAIRFDDIPSGNGTKSVRLPSLDDLLRGKSEGVLTPEGNAIFYQLPRSEWEAIKAMYGDMQCFHQYQGRPPLVAEVESVIAARSGAYREDIEATDTKLGQADPTKLNVKEVKDGEE